MKKNKQKNKKPYITIFEEKNYFLIKWTDGHTTKEEKNGRNYLDFINEMVEKYPEYNIVIGDAYDDFDY